MDRSRFTLVFIALLLPLTLLAQPQVEWVWTSEDPIGGQGGFRIAETSDNGVIVVAQYGMFVARLDASGSLEWLNTELRANAIAELGDSTLLAANSDSIFRLSSAGNVLNTIDSFPREYDLVERVGDLIAVSYAFESQVWEGDEWEFRGYSGTLIYNDQGTRLRHRQTEWCDWGSCHLVVSDFCSPSEGNVYQVDQEYVSQYRSTVRKPYGEPYQAFDYFSSDQCLEPRNPRLTSNPSGHMFEVFSLIGFCDSLSNLPRVEVMQIYDDCTPGQPQVLLDSSHSVSSIVAFEGTSDGGFVIAVNAYDGGAHLKLLRLTSEFQILWEFTDFLDGRFIGDNMIISAEDRITIAGVAHLEDGSPRACVLRLGSLTMPPTECVLSAEADGVRLTWSRGWTAPGEEYLVWRGNDIDNIATIVATTTDTTFLDTETPASYARQFYHVTARNAE